MAASLVTRMQSVAHQSALRWHCNRQILFAGAITRMKYISYTDTMTSRLGTAFCITDPFWEEYTGITNGSIHKHLAPVPLSIFRSNSKFDENSECSSFEYTRPITTIFCTRHDSDTVVTCAKYRCDRPRILYTRVFWIFIEFRIRSKYA